MRSPAEAALGGLRDAEWAMFPNCACGTEFQAARANCSWGCSGPEIGQELI